MQIRFLIGALLTAQPVMAQRHMPTEALVSDFERQRAAVIEYVNAMPDSALGYRPTPGVRTFAEQIEHIVLSAVNVSSFVLGEPRPDLGVDSTKYRRDKAALRDFVNGGFDRLVTRVRKLTPEELERSFEMKVISTTKPVWRWLLWFQEHGAWTLGQTVPYLRLNGVKPPNYFPI